DEVIEDFVSIGDTRCAGARCRRNRLTKECLRSVVVTRLIEKEISASLNGPTAQTTRDFVDVGLRVTAVYTERVQLHQLTRVILIDLRVSTRVVVEINEHRRTVRACLQ